MVDEMEITNVKVECWEYSDYALSCEYQGARYHVWLDRKTRELRGEKKPGSIFRDAPTLFKNPAVGTNHPVDFRTRKLRPNSRFGFKIILAMRQRADAEDLFSKAEASLREESEAESQRECERQRLILIQATAPDLLEALKECRSTLTRLGIVGDSAFLMADAAINKAEGKS